MSAIEWLFFITPWVWALVAGNTLALLPFQRKSLSPRRITVTVALLAAALVGWLMALLATHILQHPLARINVFQASQVIVTLTLIALAVLLIIRLIQGENWLTAIIYYFGRLLKPVFTLLALIAPAIFHILTSAYAKYADEKLEDDRKKEERERQDKIHINWRGDYSGQDHRHRY